MSFNFAEFIAQGRAAKDRRIQSQRDHQFRLQQEARIAAGQERSLDLQAEAGDRAQQQVDLQGDKFDFTKAQTAIDNAFRDSQTAFQNNLATRNDLRQQGVFENEMSQFVDFVINGQDSRIRNKDLFALQTARFNANTQRKAQDFQSSPIGLTQEILDGSSAARTGDFSGVVGQHDPRLFSSVIGPAVQFGTTAEGQFTETETIRNRENLEGSRQVLEHADDVLAPIDFSNVQPKVSFFERLGAFGNRSKADRLDARNDQRRDAIRKEVNQLGSNIKALTQMADELPVDPEAGVLRELAGDVTQQLNIAEQAISIGGFSKLETEEMAQHLLRMSSEIIQHAPGSNPEVQNIKAKISRELSKRKPDIKKVVELTEAANAFLSTFNR